jgi:hypothetical protein
MGINQLMYSTFNQTFSQHSKYFNYHPNELYHVQDEHASITTLFLILVLLCSMFRFMCRAIITQKVTTVEFLCKINMLSILHCKNHRIASLKKWLQVRYVEIPDPRSSRCLNFVRRCLTFVKSSVQNSIRVTILEPRILRWLLDFWKICAPWKMYAPLVYMYVINFNKNGACSYPYYIHFSSACINKLKETETTTVMRFKDFRVVKTCAVVFTQPQSYHSVISPNTTL